MSETIDRINSAMEGRYHVERELGEGGMATVYLVRDVRHDRHVALKVLKPELAAIMGGERFLSEIRTTANLQHPHILPLFDSGEVDGLLYYVMPYVQGESLRDRIDRDKQLPIEEAVRLAKAVAGALDHAHRQGVIHRDIKPANILLQDGQPVVADFGIALAVTAAGGGRLTETGLSLGTPYYMSPEQATADRDPGPQSDVYSLACVLYEMIAGDPPHTGSSAQAVLARILTDRPRPLHELRETVPPHVSAAVARGLAKVPADRFESAAAFGSALDDLSFTYAPTAATTVLAAPAAGAPMAAPARGSRVAWGVAAFAVVVAALGWLWPAPEVPASSVVRVQEVLEVESAGGGRRVAISPDGRWLAYQGGGNSFNDQHIFVRASDQTEWRALDGTVGGGQPDFSPTSDWIVFNGGELKKVPVGGGPVLVLDEEGLSNPRWGDDGFIYGTTDGSVRRVPEAGGAPEVLVEESSARYASPLPDGSAVLYSTFVGLGDTDVHILDLETRESTLLLPAAVQADYLPTGHLIYGHESQTLMAVPFDLRTHTVTGTPAPVLPQLSVFSGGATQFAVSDRGTAVYLHESGSRGSQSLVLVDLEGNVDGLAVEASPNRSTPRFSPDGRYIAFDDEGNIHVFDTELGTNAPLTFGGGDMYPVWDATGATLAFQGTGALRRVSVDGSTPAQLLLADSAASAGVFPHAWSTDGRYLVAREGAAGQDLLIIDVERGTSVPYLNAEWDEMAAALSPNGRWLAYMSDESGDDEVYVRSFPEPGARHQISVGGGQQPVWSPDGTRLYYRHDNDLLAAGVSATETFELLGRETLLRGMADLASIAFSAGFDVHPDGDRFVFFQGQDVDPGLGRFSDDAVLTVVTGWFTELRERLGEGR